MAIIVAARMKFAEQGFERTTIRAIAQNAKVDPALIHHFFKNKEGLFTAAIAEILSPDTLLPPVLAPGLDGLGERLVQMFLGVWESGENTREALIATIRSTVSNEQAAEALRNFIEREIASRISELIVREDVPLRTALIASQLVGMVMMRYVSKVEPLASMPSDAVVGYLAPTLNYYLNEDLNSTTQT